MFIKKKNETLKCIACGNGNLKSVLFSIKKLPLVDKFLPSLNEAKSVPISDINLLLLCWRMKKMYQR